MAFTHLHVHTEYSLLDGAARIKKLVSRAKELGMDSLAITDHGNMFGVIEFYRECKAQGIKPVIGCEVYTAARKMTDKDPEKDKYQGHLILLAENNEGYRNLIKIVSRGYLDGFYYKPRIDKDVLREYSSGIIALSGCLAGNIQRKLMLGDYNSAKQEAGELLEIFGSGNFFLEVQDQGLEEEARILPDMKKLSKELEIPLAATNDVHYVNQEDAAFHDVLLCIQTGALVSDENRMRFPNDQFYLKSENEMKKIFAGIPDAVSNTHKIAKRCDVTFTFGELHLPEFIPPEGISKSEYLRELCYKGLHERYENENGILQAVRGDSKGDINKTSSDSKQAASDNGRTSSDRKASIDDGQTISDNRQTGSDNGRDSGNRQCIVTEKEIIDRLEYELETIENMGYVEYFLIVWDFINFAKEHGIAVGPGRGSAAGSIVAYTLKITDIDPIRYNLIFERFLNPERVSMPDIDVDFCYERRQEVIDYVVEKYGHENVSQIITFGTMKAKAAIRDVGRVLSLSYPETDAVAKAIPFSLKMTIDKALEMNSELKEKYDNDEEVRRVIDFSRDIEGMPRHASTHAAGVVISRSPLDEYVPMYLSDKGPATQFPMTTIEELGLLKMDFLGLRTLTVIRDALDMIKENHSVQIDFTKMQYDDPKVFRLIEKGNTLGVFQLESGGMTQFMKNLKPDCFEDIVAGISLYRPGPMDSIPMYIRNKKNPENIKYIDDSLEPILSVTYGCLVYQEQVMQVVRDLAGYSYGRSDLMRRAMSKKKMDVMLQEKEVFINGQTDENGAVIIPGCVRNGVPQKAAEEIYNQMVSFAEYAFNKSHAAAYAVIAYETAYLKTYYPVEFMASIMSSVMGDAVQISKYIRNCREMGIDVLPPDVNESGLKFTVTGSGQIRFGLMGIKHMGEGPAKEIVRARKENGTSTDIFNFINSLDIHEINKKGFDSLIKAGALDSLEGNRAQKLAIYESLIESAQSISRKNIEGQLSMFSMDGAKEAGLEIKGSLPQIKEFNRKQLTALEKEMLGVYITDHPLKEYEDIISKNTNVTSDQLARIASEENMDVTGESSKSAIYETTVTDGMKVTVAGIIASKKSLITKNSKQMAFINIEDFYGQIEIVVFPNVFAKYKDLIEEDRIVLIKGTVNFKEEEMPKILADSIADLENLSEYYNENVSNNDFSTISNSNAQSYDVPETHDMARNSADIVPDDVFKTCRRIVKIRTEKEKLYEVLKILKKHNGETPVIIYLKDKGAMKTTRDHWVDASPAFIEEMTALATRENLKIEEREV